MAFLTDKTLARDYNIIVTCSQTKSHISHYWQSNNCLNY